MAVQVEKLVAQLEARIDKYETNLAKARKKTDKEFGRIEKRGKKMEHKLSKLGKGAAQLGVNLSKGLLGGLVAGGIAGSIAAIGQVADQVARVGDEAKRAGVDVEAFQELKYVAEQNRVGVDALTDGLKEMNLRADEFISTGKGSSAEAFSRLGYSAEELNEKLKSPSKLFTEIIGKLQQFDQAAQIRIADEIFGGTGGEQFVQLIEQGEAGLNKTIAAARELGVVMSEETIKKAQELDEKFNIVATTVGTGLKKAIVEATSALADFLSKFQEIEKRTQGALEQRQSELMSRWGEIGDEIARQQELAANFSHSPAMVERSKIFIAGLRDEMSALLAEEARITAELNKRVGGDGLDATKPKRKPTVVHNGNAEAADREAKAVRNLIAALEFEKSMVGVSARQQEIMNTLRKAGATATDAQREKISALIGEIYDMEAAQTQANERMAEGADLGKSFFSSFANGLRQGKSLADSLLDAVNRVVDRLLDASLDAVFSPKGFGGGSNPLTSIFSWLMGNGKREGGHTGFGRDSELAGVHHKNEFVMNAPATRRLGVGNLQALQNGSLKPRDIVAPVGGGRGGAMGGGLDVRVTSIVENGNLVHKMAEVAGQVGGQLVKQSERELGGRMQQARLNREAGFV
ncbi:phage tail tape measure protein [Maritalea sp.]|uniref:phage tail tape measure protein n=1 Tax=Maritalea sp. TaxID=2003361 RepID=UPI003EF2DE1A